MCVVFMRTGMDCSLIGHLRGQAPVPQPMSGAVHDILHRGRVAARAPRGKIVARGILCILATKRVNARAATGLNPNFPESRANHLRYRLVAQGRAGFPTHEESTLRFFLTPSPLNQPALSPLNES